MDIVRISDTTHEDGAWNGDYVDTGETANGAPIRRLGATAHYFLFDAGANGAGPEWVLRVDTNSSAANHLTHIFHAPGSADTVAVAGWSAGPVGSGPAPTVEVVAPAPASGEYRLYFAPDLGNIAQGVATGTGLTASTLQEGGALASGIGAATLQSGWQSEPIYNVITEAGPGPAVMDNGDESSTGGAMVCVHALEPGGDAPRSLTLAAEHSPDNGATWETLLEIEPITARGGYIFEIERGVLIHPHIRLNVIDISGQWVLAGAMARTF